MKHSKILFSLLLFIACSADVSDGLGNINAGSATINLVKASYSAGKYIKNMIAPCEEEQLKRAAIHNALQALRAEEKLDECLVENALYDCNNLFNCKCKEARDELVRFAGYDSLRYKKEEFEHAIRQFEVLRKKEDNNKNNATGMSKGDVIYWGSCTAITGLSVLAIMYPPLALAFVEGTIAIGGKIAVTAKTVAVGATVKEQIVAAASLVSYANTTLAVGEMVRPYVHMTEGELLNDELEKRAKKASLYDRIKEKYTHGNNI